MTEHTKIIKINMLDKYQCDANGFTFYPLKLISNVDIGNAHLDIYIGKKRVFSYELNFSNYLFEQQKTQSRLCNNYCVNPYVNDDPYVNDNPNNQKKQNIFEYNISWTQLNLDYIYGELLSNTNVYFKLRELKTLTLLHRDKIDMSIDLYLMKIVSKNAVIIDHSHIKQIQEQSLTISKNNGLEIEITLNFIGFISGLFINMDPWHDSVSGIKIMYDDKLITYDNEMLMNINNLGSEKKLNTLNTNEWMYVPFGRNIDFIKYNNSVILKMSFNCELDKNVKIMTLTDNMLVYTNGIGALCPDYSNK